MCVQSQETQLTNAKSRLHEAQQIHSYLDAKLEHLAEAALILKNEKAAMAIQKAILRTENKHRL
jgi:hypothetical protein